MTTVSAQKPPHAPYEVTLGEEILVKVEQRDDGLIVGEVEYGGDKIGSMVDPEDLGGLPVELAVDEMVVGLARYVWHELGGTPVFEEGASEKWTGRVDVQSPWLTERRVPTLGLISNLDMIEPEPEPEPEVQPVAEAAQPVAETAAATGRQVPMTREEIASVARGVVPESFLRRVVAAMGTEQLLDVLGGYIASADDGIDEVPERDQAQRALDELRSRVTPAE